ncbi:MAG: hypothetical protein ABI333_22725 [bacterium]
MNVLGMTLSVMVLAAPVGLAPGDPPDSVAAFDALRDRLGAPEQRVRQVASGAIVKADRNLLKLYLRRLQNAGHQRWIEAQRILLVQAGLTLPGPTGWFNIPKLKPGEKSPADVDMLAAMLQRPVPKDVARKQAHVLILETCSILRGLGGMRDLTIAEPLVRFSFMPYGIAFRWEVVRAIRGLGGYAVPALLKLSRLRVRDWKKERTRFLVSRFAFHLLTTMEEANAQHALATADKTLKLLLLGAYGKFRDSDAVTAILPMTNHADPDLRKSARIALRAYFKGPRPRARVRRLKLPGGQETAGMQKLYLSYRERAIIETRKALERLTSGRYDRSIPGQELVRLLFAKQDELRANRWTRRLEEALVKYRSGDLAGAMALGDEILRNEPEYPGRARLFPLLAERAARLTLEGRLAQAAALLERAAHLLPAGGDAHLSRQRRLTLADATYLRALHQEAGGRTARAVELHRQALTFWPHHLGSQVALMHLAPTPRADPTLLWVILLLAALGCPALLVLIRSLMRLRE